MVLIVLKLNCVLTVNMEVAVRFPNKRVESWTNRIVDLFTNIFHFS